MRGCGRLSRRVGRSTLLIRMLLNKDSFLRGSVCNHHDISYLRRDPFSSTNLPDHLFFVFVVTFNPLTSSLL